MIEINERVGWPQFVAQFLARDEFSAALEEERQDLKGFLLQLDLDPILAEFSGSKVNFEGGESQGLWRCGFSHISATPN